MKKLLSVLVLSLTVVSVAGATVVPGHRLPEGPERPVRERTVDIQSLRAELTFDMERQEISGIATIRFSALSGAVESLAVDAADLAIARVEAIGPDGESTAAPFTVEERLLRVELPSPASPGQEWAVRIAYSCRPTSGMYFFPRSPKGSPQAWNYGEGGLHYGWLPLYNDTNDRFAVELELTVARPYVALGNGLLEETRENPDGSRTFRWVQQQEIPNYLLAVDVGEFVEVPLAAARVGDTEIPLSVWVEAGREAEAAYAFGDTPRMVEFFSERFGYPYVWPKYDQVALREFAGAMETTTMVGFGENYLRLEAAPRDAEPDLTVAYSDWSSEDTIAHELAHHWFGDLLTCRSLGSIWLNESFATFAHTVWNGYAYGEDDLTYQRWRYRDSYLDYVRRTGTVRPLEYDHFEAPDDMYQSETTYIKGALVLHMLKQVVGEEAFWHAIEGYLETHAFSEVEATDLQRSLEAATGRNLDNFFADWILGGGGHPRLRVDHRWSPERQQVDLTIEQVQADLPFEDLFRLPVAVEIVTAAGATTHTVELTDWTTQVTLPASGPPQYVVFDKGNWLVAEIAIRRPLTEVLAQLAGGDLAARLQAVRQVSDDFPQSGEGRSALERVLSDRQAHWGLRQEAALALGTIGRAGAVSALVAALEDGDRNIRRAAVIGLGRAGGDVAAEALARVIETDSAEEVVGAAAAALGRIDAAAGPFLAQLMERDSSWWNTLRIGAMLGLAELEDEQWVPLFRAYTSSDYEIELRQAALDGWTRATPSDPDLAARLRELAADDNLTMRSDALSRLGDLHRADDLPFLDAIATGEPDPNLARAARDAAATIRAFNP